jgi:hypothetical protein
MGMAHPLKAFRHQPAGARWGPGHPYAGDLPRLPHV